jgi:polysaccharide export outer membrane protein
MRKIISAVIVTIYISCIPAMGQVDSRKVTPPKNQTQPAVSPNPATATPAAVTPKVEEYVIGAQDLLDISVWGESQFDLKVTVRPDGKIGVKLLGDVPAGGLTTKQVEKLITEGLKPWGVPNAHVTVIVLEIHSQTVTIMGNGVAHTGAYPIGGQMRVVDLLARAGLNDFAKKSDIMIIREEGEKRFTKFPFDYDSFVKGNYYQNILLRNGDTVIVP